MDSSETHYITYDPEAIWEEMMKTYIAEGGDVLYPGDEKEILLRAVLADIVQAFAGVDNALRMRTLRYAVGDYLDLLGEQRGCTRIQASAATATVTITTNATGETDALEAGTTMTADGQVFYRLTEDFPITGVWETRTAEIEAVEPGAAGNGLPADTEMTLSIPHPGVNSIIVTTAAGGGSEEEADDAYRERIREYDYAKLTTGPERQYEAKARTVSSRIVDAKAVNEGAGKVGVYLLLGDRTGAEAVLESVRETLSAENVRPMTDLVNVYEAANVPYTLNVEFIYDGTTTARSALDEAVESYRKWQDRTIGRAFDPYHLMALLYQAGATRVIWGEGSHFNGGPVDYTTIGRTERCDGTITLTAIEG